MVSKAHKSAGPTAPHAAMVSGVDHWAGVGRNRSLERVFCCCVAHPPPNAIKQSAPFFTLRPIPMSDVIAAHKRSSNHRAELQTSEWCGCFHCTATFASSAINEWVDWPPETPKENRNAQGTTAMCPICGIDSVIGSASGYPITKEFLEQMRGHWFD